MSPWRAFLLVGIPPGHPAVIQISLGQPEVSGSTLALGILNSRRCNVIKPQVRVHLSPMLRNALATEVNSEWDVLHQTLPADFPGVYVALGIHRPRSS